MFFKKVTFLKAELHLCFLLSSLLEPLTQCNLNANYAGEILTSQAVWYHLVSSGVKVFFRSAMTREDK